MAEEEGTKEEGRFELYSTGEALGYISLDQARVLAMEQGLLPAGAPPSP